MNFRDKVVIVTGASRGIGLECVRLLRGEDARVVLAARSRDRLLEVAAPGELMVAGDLTSEGDRQALIAQTVERHGRIDVLINNAGAGLYGPTLETDPAVIRQLFELNLFAPLDLARLARPYLVQTRGVIAMVSSIAGQVALPWMTSYSASKFALNGYAAGLRMELASNGVHVVAICPGYVKTDFQEHALGGKVPESVRSKRRFGITPEACAAAIVDAVRHRKRLVPAPRANRLLTLAAALFPGVVERRMIRMLEQG